VATSGVFIRLFASKRDPGNRPVPDMAYKIQKGTKGLTLVGAGRGGATFEIRMPRQRHGSKSLGRYIE